MRSNHGAFDLTDAELADAVMLHSHRSPSPLMDGELRSRDYTVPGQDAQAELSKRRQVQLAKFDQNSDGSLSREEFRALLHAAAAAGDELAHLDQASMDLVWERLDTNKNGMVRRDPTWQLVCHH